MSCPFPGMNPYLEYSGSWPDFHDSLITFLRLELNQAIRPRYSAVSQERLVVVEHERNIQPDVTILSRPTRERGSAVAVMEADPAIVFEAARSSDLLREPYLQIVDPKAGGRVITTIEVLSPHNKIWKGRLAYRANLDECWNADVNVVEIDLLSEGESILRPEFASSLPPGDSPYVVAVSRCTPPRYEVYRVQLQDRLPRIAVPLAADDKDVVLDLQSAFARTWESGAYPEMLHYDRPLPGEWTESDQRWMKERVTQTEAGKAN